MLALGLIEIVAGLLVAIWPRVGGYVVMLWLWLTEFVVLFGAELNAAIEHGTADGQIGPLADNGGPTWTHALLPGSPALDAADDAICPATDQRGTARPQGPHCDIGAFELTVP